MQAVLYVAHGTRVTAGVEQAIQFIERTKTDIPMPIQEICFLELAQPDIAQGVAKCVEQGATSIAIVPILLLTAQHANEDIPEEIAKAQTLYPHVNMTYGRPFGVHDKLVATIHKRIIEQQQPIHPKAEVLVIGRGSSDLAVQRDLGKLADKLKNDYGYHQVSTCFLYGSGRTFDEALQDLQARNVKQVFVVPYLLFTGLLRNGIVKKMEEFVFDINRVVLCDSLGYDDNVRQVLVERVLELLPISNEVA